MVSSPHAIMSREPAWLSEAEIVRPGDLREAREMILDGAGMAGARRDARGRRADQATALLVRGSGTKLAWGRAAERVDRVIDTAGLNRLVAHDPGDMTATVQAGMTLAGLRSELARAGQELAVDPPLGQAVEAARSATLGGIFACNDSGPRRLRYGSLRELVIGATVILADGTVARSGGRVIKNVAGYDLCKLFCGAFGTLGMVAELTVRLHPVPERVCTLRTSVDVDRASSLGVALMASPLEPAAVDHDGETLWIRFEGSEAQAVEQRVRGREFVVAQGLECDVVPEAEQDEQWRALSEDGAGSAGETVLRVATLPGQLAPLGEIVRGAGQDRDAAIAMTSQVCLGLHTVRLAGGDAAGHAAITRHLRARVIELGGHVVIRQKCEGFDGERAEGGPESSPAGSPAGLPAGFMDPFGPPPSSFVVMKRIKAELDPDRRFSPGRFVGGL